jgi:hypothetical protein
LTPLIPDDRMRPLWQESPGVVHNIRPHRLEA